MIYDRGRTLEERKRKIILHSALIKITYASAGVESARIVGDNGTIVCEADITCAVGVDEPLRTPILISSKLGDRDGVVG